MRVGIGVPSSRGLRVPHGAIENDSTIIFHVQEVRSCVGSNAVPLSCSSRRIIENQIAIRLEVEERTRCALHSPGADIVGLVIDEQDAARIQIEKVLPTGRNDALPPKHHLWRMKKSGDLATRRRKWSGTGSGVGSGLPHESIDNQIAVVLDSDDG